MLLDCRKGSISFSSSWWRHGAGLSGSPKEAVRREQALQQPLCCLPQPCQRRAGCPGLQGTVDSQGSCLLSWRRFLFVSAEQRGRAPDPRPLPPPGMKLPEAFLSGRGREFLSCLPRSVVVSEGPSVHECPTASGSNAGHGWWPPASEPVGWEPWSQPPLLQGYFLLGLFPHLHSSVTGFTISWV